MNKPKIEAWRHRILAEQGLCETEIFEEGLFKGNFQNYLRGKLSESLYAKGSDGWKIADRPEYNAGTRILDVKTGEVGLTVFLEKDGQIISEPLIKFMQLNLSQLEDAKCFTHCQIKFRTSTYLHPKAREALCASSRNYPHAVLELLVI